jgi:hypothetical protein
MTSITFSHDCIIIDACCAINLYASGRMGEMLSAVPKRIAIGELVYSTEMLKIWGDPSKGTTQSEAIDVQNLVDSGVLSVVTLESGDEEVTFVNFAAALRDDGEAYTGAIALHRNWAIATDDRRAINYFKQEAKHLQIITTPELIKHWVDTTGPQDNLVREVLRNVQVQGRYRPHKDHPLLAWWQSFI